MIDLKKQLEYANLNDIEEIHSIFVAVTQWLRSMDVLQWDFSYPDKEIITKDIESKSCLVLRINEKIAAVVSLNQEQDPQYQKVRWKGGDNGIWVIHRLAVNPLFQNQGLATKLCLHLEKLVLDSEGKVIRLDAYSENPYSNKMYIKLGYKAMAEQLYFHGNKVPFNAYEKIL